MARAIHLFLFFFLFSRYQCYVSKEVENTFAMIKPDGLNHTTEIKKIVVQSGFSIVKEMTIRLSEDDAKLFYAEHSNRGFFGNLVKYMTSGQVIAMVLEKENAVADWRDLIGPTDASKAKITHPNRYLILLACQFKNASAYLRQNHPTGIGLQMGHVWPEFGEELRSWFRFPSICHKGDLIFLRGDGSNWAFYRT